MEHFGQVQGAARRTLGDLLAATETVGNDEPIGWCLADGGEQFQFSDGDGDIVLLGIEAERAGHTAASGSGAVEVDADAAQDGLFGGHLHQRFLMAMAVEDRWTIEAGRRKVWGVGFEEFAKQEGLPGEGLRTFFIGEQVEEFVAKNCDTTRFKADHWDACINFRREFVKNLKEKSFGAGEHAVVVERTAAAEVWFGDGDAEAGGFKDLDRGDGGGGMEIVVKCVGPEENGLHLRG